MTRNLTRIAILAIAAAPLPQAGCTRLGPATIRGDRFNYNAAGAESTKEQLLLNIVRLRYGEPIYVLEINSMLSQYAVEAGGSGSYWYNGLNTLGPALRAAYGLDGEADWQRQYGGDLKYSDRPTITYAPVQGEQFAKQVMSPIPPATLIYLSESGWGIDRLLQLCVQRINDVTNEPIQDAEAPGPEAGRQFRRLTSLLKKLQDAGRIRFIVQSDSGAEQAYFYSSRPGPDLAETVNELKRLLGYEGDTPERLRLVAGPVQLTPDDLSMQTRSLLATMYAMSKHVEVPAEHHTGSETSDGIAAGDLEDGAKRWLVVKFGRLPQIDPFVQVFYNGYWFYIEKSDWSSKRTFALLTYLFSLQAGGLHQGMPVVTVPAGGR